jgi:hypothetical protein
MTDSKAPNGHGEGMTRFTDALRAVIAGGEAAKLVSAGAALFQAGGRHVLSEGARQAVRGALERGAGQALAAAIPTALAPAAALATKRAVEIAPRALAFGARSASLAAKEVLRGAGKAAGIGFAIDGAVAGLEAILAHRAGTMDGAAAAKHVAKEASTGAVATGAGVLVGAGLVAVTGGIGAPVVFAASAFSAIAAKRALRRVTARKR